MDIPAMVAARGQIPLAFQTHDRRHVTLRRVRSSDAPLLAELLGRLSDRTWQLRYFAARPLADEAVWREAGRMMLGRQGRHLTLVAIGRPRGEEEAIAVAELVRDADTPAAGEIALVVRDDYQANGVGSLLGRRLLHLARAARMTTVRADLLVENRGALRLLNRLGVPYTATIQDGATRVLAHVPDELGAGWAGERVPAHPGDARARWNRRRPSEVVREWRGEGTEITGA